MRPAYVLATCTDGSGVVLDLSDKVGIPSGGREGIGKTNKIGRAAYNQTVPSPRLGAIQTEGLGGIAMSTSTLEGKSSNRLLKLSRTSILRLVTFLVLLITNYTHSSAAAKEKSTKYAGIIPQNQYQEVTIRDLWRPKGELPAVVFVDKIGTGNYCSISSSSCTVTVPTGKHKFIAVRPNRKVAETVLDVFPNAWNSWDIVDSLGESITTTLSIVEDGASKNSSGASIFLDKEMVGKLPSKINISPGKHKLEIFKMGFEPYLKTIRVEIDPGKTIVTTFSENRELPILIGSETTIKPQIETRADVCEEIRRSNAGSWYAKTPFVKEGITESRFSYFMHEAEPKLHLPLEYPQASASMVFVNWRLFDFKALQALGGEGITLSSVELDSFQASDLSKELKRIGDDEKIPWYVNAAALATPLALEGAAASGFRTMWGVVKYLADSHSGISTATLLAEIVAGGGKIESLLHATQDREGRKFIHISMIYRVQIGYETRKYIIKSTRYAVKVYAELPDGQKLCIE